MIAARDILHAVAEEAGVGMDDLLSQSRRWRLSWPRQLAMLMLHEHCGLTLGQIAMKVRRQDHTTVMHGCRAARERLLAAPAYRALHDRILARLETAEAAE